MKLLLAAVPAMLLGLTITAYAEVDVLPSGTSITVRTNESINARNANDGRVYSAVIDQDVIDRRDGSVAIPRGANAELIVRELGRNDLSVDMESVTVQGRRYVVSTSDEPIQGNEKDGVGKNSRTGKYVGGGAVLGTIIGAIAGGGKGAAIGAVAGGAAGAGTQVITRGRDVRIPSESLLTFRLDRSLEVGRGDRSRDNGYDRDGTHYHRNNNSGRNDDNNRRDR
jgi:hypothetical protein